jgi:ankyrin repeat protein
MSRKLTSATALENLKREAKRWLKALRDNAADAHARLEQALPDAPPVPTLRDVQHALSRELGFSGWQAMRDGVRHAAPGAASPAQLLQRFLDNACPDHHVRGARDHVRAEHTAMRLLAQHPDIADASFSARVVTGNAATVAASLAERPTLATTPDSAASKERSGSGGTGDLIHRDLGAKGWEPLLYLTFTRLPLQAVSANAVSIAQMLLDAGANPNAHFMAGGSKYTPLVGVIGEGEENRPPHQQRNALVRLLLERGADPYDMQVMYNIHFHGDMLWFLELAYERAVQLGRQSDWGNPEWPMFDMGNFGSGARFVLGIAIEHDDVRLAEWCLAHGASANAAPARGKRASPQSLYEQAVRRGGTDIAALLARYGGEVVDVTLTESEAFSAACMRMDRAVINAMLTRNPALLGAPEPMLEAARRDRVNVIELLLALGMSPDVANDRNERPLHGAAYNNSLNAARLLIDRGAEIDAVEKSWDNTPLAAAAYSHHTEMIELLSQYSRDVRELTYSGKVDRVRTLLDERPELGRIAGGGHTPLMWLPTDDEHAALKLGRLFLSHGADASPRNKEGMTAAERAERIGMSELASLLRRAESHLHPASR